ncbi:protein of unknown function [Methylacidimicrobium sp. AP8]|uniref:hypothetical protein n=1 Tax=Methylacidimicrobium sp. AP8 TaxID=2730359 RepID=UPI0018C1293D|nr:hypothetical protein [Methylacidimicrobium sp. AP8]CAB4242478.1 protein of unknown function [Methylacidimicrobium sp. AP8]
MPRDSKEAVSREQDPESLPRHFSSEGADAAQARLAGAGRRSSRWQHSAQRKRDRNRFFFFLLLLAVIVYILWKQWSPYLVPGGAAAR